MLVYGLVLIVHVLVAVFLIAVILLQGGRGGLGEALGGAAAQSLFGGSANTVMTKITAVCAGLFMVTCLSLAMLSTQRGRSVVDRLPASVDQLPLSLPTAAEPPGTNPRTLPRARSAPSPTPPVPSPVLPQPAQAPQAQETPTPSASPATASP